MPRGLRHLEPRAPCRWPAYLPPGSVDDALPAVAETPFPPLQAEKCLPSERIGHL